MRKKFSVAVLLALIMWFPVVAINVTTPEGVLDNPAGGGETLNDPFVADTWLRLNVRDGSTVGITDNYPRGGTASAYFSGTVANTSKADFEYYWSDTTGKTLGNLTNLQYEWYRDPASTNPDVQHPAFRLAIDVDGNLATTTDRGYLIYEGAYNGLAVAPEGVWQTVNITTANFWFRWFGPPGQTCEVYDQTLAEWQSNPPPGACSGFPDISSSTLVTGISFGIGSGWNGVFQGAVDNVELTFAGQDPLAFNFEFPPTPVLTNTLYVADTTNNRVQVFDSATATWSLVAGTDGVTGSAPNRFNRPEGVVANNGTGADLRIYVADTGNNRIQWFDGTTWGTFASVGSSLAQVRAPEALALDSEGNLYVADTGNDRILRFATNPDGSPAGNATALATAGLLRNKVSGPRGLTIDSDFNLFIADTDNDRILKLLTANDPGYTNATPPPLANFEIIAASGGSINPGKVRNPEGVAVDSAGNLYVADTGNNRVIEFIGATPGPVTVLASSGSTLGGAIGKVRLPEGITVTDFSGVETLLVADSGNNRVQQFPLAGGTWEAVSGTPNPPQTGQSGSSIGQFRAPSGVR